MKAIRDIWNAWVCEGWFFFLVLFLLILSIFYSILYRKGKELEQWEKFKSSHACIVVEHIKGSVSTGVGWGIMTKGHMGTIVTTTATPDKSGWLCNDGIIYWR